MPIRKLLLNLHLCAGLIAAIFLFVMGVSGALIVFEDQIDRALNPKQYPYVQPRFWYEVLRQIWKASRTHTSSSQLPGLHLPAESC